MPSFFYPISGEFNTDRYRIWDPIKITAYKRPKIVH
jgi:hypothetical protein